MTKPCVSIPETAPVPSNLDTAIKVAQEMLDTYERVDYTDIGGVAQAHGALRESLRILLRALDADPKDAQVTGATVVADLPPSPRCPAAHPEDPTGCNGPVVVTVLGRHNAGADGCEHHGARLLASLDGGRVYGLPDAPEGAAIRVFKAADGIRPFPWLTDAPRTRDDQLSRAEIRERGETR